MGSQYQLYEFARRIGLIDPGLDGEEAYLLQISDRNAADERTTLNFTTSPFFIHRPWRRRIQLQAAMAYIRKFGKTSYAGLLAGDTRFFARPVSEESGYFNAPKNEVERTCMADSLHGVQRTVSQKSDGLPSLWSLLRSRQLGLALICYPEKFAPFVPLLPLLELVQGLRIYGPRATVTELIGWLTNSRRNLAVPVRSLRKVVFEDMPQVASDLEAMEPLRRGR